MLTYVSWWFQKMSETRRSLGCLASEMNVGGEEYLRRRAGQELNPLDRHTRRVMERREEAWRPLNKHRVAAFIRMFLLCLVESENGHRRGYAHPEIVKIMHKTLITRIIPFICRRIVATMDERFWIISLEDFNELDHYLAANLPRVHAADRWQQIVYFFKEVVRQREEYKRMEEMEREAAEEEEEDAGATNYEQYRQIEPYYRDRDIC